MLGIWWGLRDSESPSRAQSDRIAVPRTAKKTLRSLCWIRIAALGEPFDGPRCRIILGNDLLYLCGRIVGGPAVEISLPIFSKEARSMSRSISKSKYLSGLQCPKLLWTHFNDRAAIPAPDVGKQAIFDAGHTVGDLAKERHPDGVEVPWSRDLAKTASDTMELLPLRKPIFEASFLVDGCYCRADILVPSGGDAWDLYEVKSSSTVKAVNHADVAFQAHAIERSGLTLNRLFLMHIDRRYVRRGGVDPMQLFHAVNITGRARVLQAEVGAQVEQMHRVIAGERPDTPIGEHCSRPYSCDLWDQCSAYLSEDSVLGFYGMRARKAFQLIADGSPTIGDVPASALNRPQLIQQAAVREGQPQIKAENIRNWLTRIQYPIHFFDFESVSAAVPLWEGTRPYEPTPFQFSLHIIEHEGAEPQHFEFLADTKDDPREALIASMKIIRNSGSILVYNMLFEAGILSDLAVAFPDESDFLLGLKGRLLDLMTPFRRFWIHDARQQGSCSLKNILPVLTTSTYEGMAIADGRRAMTEFERVVFGEVEAAEKERVMQELRDYCCQDTMALVDVLDALWKMV
jgi:Domain of unknown function(DUF2779)